jgi:hypothetical protein
VSEENTAAGRVWEASNAVILSIGGTPFRGLFIVSKICMYVARKSDIPASRVIIEERLGISGLGDYKGATVSLLIHWCLKKNER